MHHRSITWHQRNMKTHTAQLSDDYSVEYVLYTGLKVGEMLLNSHYNLPWWSHYIMSAHLLQRQEVFVLFHEPLKCLFFYWRQIASNLILVNAIKRTSFPLDSIKERIGMHAVQTHIQIYWITSRPSFFPLKYPVTFKSPSHSASKMGCKERFMLTSSFFSNVS